MKLTLTISNASIADRACEVVRGLTFDPLHEVIIREKKKSRSTSQNSLYWKWITIFAAETGYSKDELHEVEKRKHLVPIFTRDDQDYAFMIDSLKGMPEEVKIQVIKLTSTTKANVKQMTEYMEAVEREAIGLNCSLPHPEEYYEAMGKKTT